MLSGGGTEVRQEFSTHLDHDDAGSVHIRSAVALGEHLREQFCQRPGRLDAGWPAADNDAGECPFVNELWVAFGCLEAAEDVLAELDRFAQRVQGEGVVGNTWDPKVVGRRAGSED